MYFCMAEKSPSYFPYKTSCYAIAAIFVFTTTMLCPKTLMIFLSMMLSYLLLTYIQSQIHLSPAIVAILPKILALNSLLTTVLWKTRWKPSLVPALVEQVSQTHSNRKRVRSLFSFFNYFFMPIGVLLSGSLFEL